MSYILDALRRAEAERERERGQVPGLHSQTLPGADTGAIPARPRWLPWAGGGLLVMAGVGAGLWWSSGPGAGSPAAEAPVALPPPPAIAPAPAPMVTATPTVPPPATVDVAPSPAVATPPASPYLPPPLARPAPAIAPTPATRDPAPAAAPAPLSGARPVAPATPAPAPADTRLPRVAELPEAVRRELPRLAISGSVYSDDAPSRFVIINGDVAHEGATLAPDLVLEQIRPRELVLRFKGQRFRQPV